MAQTRARRRRWPAWLLAAALILFMAFVVYRSLHIAGYRCVVCINFRGRSECRAVDGPTAHEARMGATTNVCAYLASGVTDSLACERTMPAKADCQPIQ